MGPESLCSRRRQGLLPKSVVGRPALRARRGGCTIWIGLPASLSEGSRRSAGVWGRRPPDNSAEGFLHPGKGVPDSSLRRMFSRPKHLPARARRGPERRTSGHPAAVLALAVSAVLCGNVARADSYPSIIPQGLSLIANQLNHGSNKAKEVFANIPNGCVLSKYNNCSGTRSNAYFSAGSWMPGTLTLSPGEGA